MNLDERMKIQAQDVYPDEALKSRTVFQMEAASDLRRTRGAGRMTVRRFAAVLAAFVLILGIGAGAAYASGLLPGAAAAFGRLFGTGEKQNEILDTLTTPNAVSCVNGGIRVAATAQLVDKKVVVVQLCVSRENGEPLLPADTEDYDCLYFGATGGNFGNEFTFFGRNHLEKGQFPDYVPGDAEAYAYFLFEKTTDEEISSLNFGMTRLTAVYAGRGEDLADQADDAWWEMDIPIYASNEGLTLAEGAEFAANGHTFRIDGIHVSPFAVLVDYTVTSTTVSEYAEYIWIPNEDKDGSYAYEGYEIACDTRPFWENIDLALRLKDGTVIDMSTYTMGQPVEEIVNPVGHIETDMKRDLIIAHRGDVLPRIISYEDMDCVILGGIEYPVN